MHILYVHQYFSTREGAAGTRSYELSRALVEKGHKVTMVCGKTDRSLTGLEQSFEGGRRSGTVDGISVVEFDVSYKNQDNLIVRAWKFFAFAYYSTGEALGRDYDLLFATSTPLTVVIPGFFARVLRQKPFVFEVRDLWPELPIAMGLRNPFAIGAMKILEWLGYRWSNRTIALAPGIAEGIRRAGVPQERIAVIPNGCDMDLGNSVVPLKPFDFLPQSIGPQDFVAVFSGAHGLANGLDAVLDGASKLKHFGRHDIKILLVGDGAQKNDLIESARKRELSNVIFHDPIRKTELMRLLKGADIGLQILADVQAFYRGTSPNKFFDYLSVGTPVLINYPGWLADFVRAEECGFAIAPRDPSGFALALIQAADNRKKLLEMGSRARALGMTRFDRAMLAQDFVSTIERAAPAAAGAEPP